MVVSENMQKVNKISQEMSNLARTLIRNRPKTFLDSEPEVTMLEKFLKKKYKKLQLYIFPLLRKFAFSNKSS